MSWSKEASCGAARRQPRKPTEGRAASPRARGLLARIEHVEPESEPDFFDLFIDGCRFAPLPATGRPPLLWSVVGPQSRSEFNYLRIWASRLRRKLGAPVGSSGPIRAFQGIGYLLDSHWTAEIEGGLGEEPDPVTGATTEPGAETDPEPVEVGPPED
jgi:hypothetical protein